MKRVRALNWADWAEMALDEKQNYLEYRVNEGLSDEEIAREIGLTKSKVAVARSFLGIVRVSSRDCRARKFSVKSRTATSCSLKEELNPKIWAALKKYAEANNLNLGSSAMKLVGEQLGVKTK